MDNAEHREPVGQISLWKDLHDAGHWMLIIPCWLFHLYLRDKEYPDQIRPKIYLLRKKYYSHPNWHTGPPEFRRVKRIL